MNNKYPRQLLRRWASVQNRPGNVCVYIVRVTWYISRLHTTTLKKYRVKRNQPAKRSPVPTPIAQKRKQRTIITRSLSGWHSESIEQRMSDILFQCVIAGRQAWGYRLE